MIRLSLIFIFFLSISKFMEAQSLKVSNNERFLVTENGDPFFWLADTAWELFHRCNREEASYYLETRKEQGFNVIHAVVLAELDGLRDPNPYGEIPLIDMNPLTPNEMYFKHVDYIIDKADELDMYIALLPTWGDKVFKESWGVGPEIFNPENARKYGNWIGDRYKNYDNIIWIIGGDRNPRADQNDVEIWNQLAEGIAESAGGYDKTLMSFHPQPRDGRGSSQWFHKEPWLDFNMHQTGHCPNRPTYKYIQQDYQLTPIKPVIDGEPAYEEHPRCFNARELGYNEASDIRRIMYWNVFSGAFGQSYGCHAVWQMYSLDKKGINGPLRPWKQSLDLPVANQIKHLKNLILSFPFLDRIPDQSLLVEEQEEDEHYIVISRDLNYSYALIYFPTGKPAFFNLSGFQSDKVKATWYDPRTGIKIPGRPVKNDREIGIRPPSSGKGNDWVLILEN